MNHTTRSLAPHRNDAAPRRGFGIPTTDCVGNASIRTICRSLVFGLFVACTLTACATTARLEPQPSPAVSEEAKSAEKDGVRVMADILGDLEAEERFGVDLASRNLQALWIRIENGSPRRLWFLTAALDPDYYTANETALLFSDTLSDAERATLTRFLDEYAPSLAINPGQSTEGFILADRHEGGRYLNIELSGHETLLRFGFAIPVADGYFDFESLSPNRIYPKSERPDLSEAELRSALRELPCCTSDASGERNADPLNIAIVGSFEEMMAALARSGWSFTHRISLSTVGRLIQATLAGKPYHVAPVSSLYVFGRRQDIALQRARSSISQRNHMRLWLAPYTHGGRSVWVGQISRDIGVKITSKSPTFTTHVIDPYVDEAREYLLQALLHHHSVERFGFVAGIGEATPENPSTNLTDDPYYTDGLRLVVLLARQPIPPHQADNLHWKELDIAVSEGENDNEVGVRHPSGDTIAPTSGATPPAEPSPLGL